MEWVACILAVVVLGLAAVAASGRLGEMPTTVSDSPRPHVPQGRLTGDDLRDCRLDVVIRGYSMAQVDELLDRLTAQLGVSAPAIGQETTDEPVFIRGDESTEYPGVDEPAGLARVEEPPAEILAAQPRVDEPARPRGRKARKAAEAEVAALKGAFPEPSSIRPSPAPAPEAVPAVHSEEDLAQWRAVTGPARRGPAAP